MTPGLPNARPAFIGRYRIEGLIGKGGMGEVYKAFDPSLDRMIALKTIAPDADNPVYLDRLYREAKACGRLHHPHIVTVHDLGEIDGIVFIAMEYLQGEDLAAALKRGEFSFEQKIGVLIQILEALQYAHSEGVIHRDIKPSNVLVLPNGNIKLLDFGLARVSRAESLTMSGAVMGTPYYMSPEQLKGQKVDGRTDVYAVGVVAYEMLTRRRVFEGDNITTVMLKVLSEEPPPMATMWSTTFPEIERIVFRALSKNADDRYATAEDMKNALAAFLASSRAAVVTAQADMTVYAQRAVMDARTLIAEGRGEDAQTLLNATLQKNPDAAEARTLLDAQTAPLGLRGSAAGVAPLASAPVDPVSARTDVAQPVRTQVASAPVKPHASVRAPEPLRPPIPAPSNVAPPAERVTPPDAARTSRPMMWLAVAVPVALALAAGVFVMNRRGPAVETTASETTAAAVTGTAASASSSAPAPNVAPTPAVNPERAAVSAPAATAPIAAPPARSGGAASASAVPPAAAGAATASSTPAPAGGPSPKGSDKPAVAGPGSARALFSAVENAGLKYTLVQQKDGKEIDVDSSTTFHTGDKVRFNFESNIDGYLYVVTEGSSGRWTVLFPSPQINSGKNDVKRYQRYAVPAQSWFVFDQTPGTENIFVFLSKTPMAQLPGFHEPVTKTETLSPSVVEGLRQSVQARDLILEKDARDTPDAAGTPVATYVVNRDEVGQAVTATIQLVHAQ